MIKATDLIALFRQALDDKWGYIWGAAGIMWTAARQKQKVNYMVSKYGTGWKNNSEAKEDNYYGSALYGDRWIGHYVADCSGLFAWAFKKMGGAIAHGSNSIYDRYCSAKGNLSGGRRSDGKDLMPGSAVFVYKNGKRTHIGLYVGGGTVIEASGTKVGVITSNVSDKKWANWGELKNVAYDKVDPDPPEPQPDKKPTLRKGMKGEYVTLAQTMLKNKGYDLGKYGVDGSFGNATLAAVKAFQKDNGLTADGVIGKKTWEALDKNEPAQTYTVHIPFLTKDKAEALIERYPGSSMTPEGR